MSTQSEAASALEAVSTQLDKIATESAGMQSEIAKLKAVLSNGADSVSAELSAAISKVVARAQAIDDLVPDAPLVPTTPVDTGTGTGTGTDTGTGDTSTDTPTDGSGDTGTGDGDSSTDSPSGATTGPV